MACKLDVVAMQMARSIRQEWCDPGEVLPHDGEYIGGEIFNGSDILEEVGPFPESGQLTVDLQEFFAASDCCRDNGLAVSQSERLQFGWKRFCEVVSHQRRFTFWTDCSDGQSEDNPDYLPTAGMLAEITQVTNEMGLLQEFPKGTAYWRAADHAVSESLPVPNRFTSPPIEFALQPNRMSPAGISMFYGAEYFNTAVLEVCGNEIHSGRSVSAVQFESCRPLWLLDLCHLNKSVSYYAENGRVNWHRSAFLRYFASDISKPIGRDRRQHIDYVPTQVLTEFVRYHMRTVTGISIDGIRYLSSRNRHPCVVLFFYQEDCLPGRRSRSQSLSCQLTSSRTIRLDTARACS